MDTTFGLLGENIIAKPYFENHMNSSMVVDVRELSTGSIKEYGHVRADESITSRMLYLAPLLKYV